MGKIKNHISGVWNSSSVSLDLDRRHGQIRTMEHSRLHVPAAGGASDFFKAFSNLISTKSILSTIFSYVAVIALILVSSSSSLVSSELFGRALRSLHPVSSPISAAVLFAPLQVLVLPAEGSPAPLSLNKDQLKTLTNKPPGRWYPLKGPGMKEMLQFKPFCWLSGLFDECVLPLQKMLMSVLNILSTVC